MDSSWFFLECLSAPNLGNLRVDLFTKKGDWTTSHVESDSTRTWILPTKHPVKTETVDVSSHLTHSDVNIEIWPPNMCINQAKIDIYLTSEYVEVANTMWIEPSNMWKNPAHVET